MINLNEIKCSTTDFYGRSRAGSRGAILWSWPKGTLIIRHASRNHIPEGVDHTKVGLNDKGKEEANEFGRRLVSLLGMRSKADGDWASVHVRFITSPVERCVQTCEYIIEGLREAAANDYTEAGWGFFLTTEIVKSRILGAPGPFVVDEQAGALTFERYGTVGTIERLQNGTEIPGFATLKDGSQMLMDLVKREYRSDVANIMVTHDAILAPFISNYTGEYFNKEHWIDFLDGVIVKKNDGEAFQMCRNKEWWAVN